LFEVGAVSASTLGLASFYSLTSYNKFAYYIYLLLGYKPLQEAYYYHETIEFSAIVTLQLPQAEFLSFGALKKKKAPP
jgi:hypothetical protein